MDGGSLDPAPLPLKKVKFFSYDAILLRFETQQFDVYQQLMIEIKI